VQLSVVPRAGKEAVVALLDAGHFFGEGCLAGQSRRMATATAMEPCIVLTVEKQEMVRQLHAQPAFADRFLTHMLTRNIRIEEDLIDQLFNSSEKRLARTLLLLARYGDPSISSPGSPSAAAVAAATSFRPTTSWFASMRAHAAPAPIVAASSDRTLKRECSRRGASSFLGPECLQPSAKTLQRR
jgi:CRP-like cAMP-binding protein